MSNYIEPTNSFKKSSYKITAQNSVDRLVGLSDFSRYLLGSNTLQDLMERSARSIIEILNLDFDRIVTLESNGHYSCRISCNKDTSGLGRKHEVIEPVERERLFEKIHSNLPALTPVSLENAFTEQERILLGLPRINNLWIVALEAISQPIGFLFLGKKQIGDSEHKLTYTAHLVELIAGQLSNAIYRIRLNDRLTGTSLEMVKALTKTLKTFHAGDMSAE